MLAPVESRQRMGEERIRVDVIRESCWTSESQWPYYADVVQAIIRGICELNSAGDIKIFVRHVTSLINQIRVAVPDGSRGRRLRVEAGEVWTCPRPDQNNFTCVLRSPKHVSVKLMFSLVAESLPPIFLHALFHIKTVNNE
jgi:hypothetical protein